MQNAISHDDTIPATSPIYKINTRLNKKLLRVNLNVNEFITVFILTLKLQPFSLRHRQLLTLLKVY